MSAGEEEQHREAGRSDGQRRLPRSQTRERILIGWLKILLPVLAVGLVALVIALPQLSQRDPGRRLQVEDVTPEEGRRPLLVAPTFDGVDNFGRPFLLSAETASQEPGDERFVDLRQPSGTLRLDDDLEVTVRAASGRFDRDEEQLDLSGGVSLHHGDGFELHTEAASVYIAEGRAESTTHVRGSGPMGRVESQGMRVEKRGAVVIFTGPAKLWLDGEDEAEGVEPR